MKFNFKYISPVLLLIFMAFYVAEKIPFLYPVYFPKPIYDFRKNPLTKEKIELGRHLFYDPVLSKNEMISCASCHSSYNAFAHTDHNLSHGIDDSIGNRNAPALFNLAWQKDFMWDGAIHHIDFQPLAPINHPKEMGETTNNVVNKLNHSKKYKTLFYKAYGDSSATGEKMLKALTQFQLTLVSFGSKYDKVKQGKAKFTEREQRGYEVFLNKCNSCHTEPLFSDYKFQNIGLPVDKTLNDYGRMTITKLKKDSLKFKTPSLRNISYSYPYMHDGRFKRLSEILEHYTTGMERSPTIAKELVYPIIFSSNEKADLISFLLCLNDSAFVFNPNHQFPRN